jgi:hypothetical protein
MSCRQTKRQVKHGEPQAQGGAEAKPNEPPAAQPAQ